ncbi:MAG: hypothetical protein FWG48_02925 [Oscillospiraceae bacterium]|nr:hypothetical protein [Oscillospiraceae bacterium]
MSGYVINEIKLQRDIGLPAIHREACERLTADKTTIGIPAETVPLQPGKYLPDLECIVSVIV